MYSSRVLPCFHIVIPAIPSRLCCVFKERYTSNKGLELKEDLPSPRTLCVGYSLSPSKTSRSYMSHIGMAEAQYINKNNRLVHVSSARIGDPRLRYQIHRPHRSDRYLFHVTLEGGKKKHSPTPCPRCFIHWYKKNLLLLLQIVQE